MADKTLDRRIAEVQVERQKACSVPLRTEVGPALAHTLCLAEPPEVKVMYLFAGKPRGFPWLSQHHKAVVEEASMFVDRCITACITCRAAGGKFIIENPEDLSLVKDERSGSGSGQKFWTSFLLATPTHLQFNNVTLVPSLPNQRGFLARLNFRMRDVIWLGAYKGALPKSCGHTHKTNFWARRQTNGIQVRSCRPLQISGRLVS